MFVILVKYKIILLILLLLLILYLSLSWYIANRFVQPHPKRLNTSPTIISTDYEEITIKGQDAIALHGWLFHAPSDKLIILIHGITQNRVNDDYYTMFLAKDLLASGYNVLMYDSRAHGESEGNKVTYGIKEHEDIVQVVNFAKTKGFTPNHIGIIADSLGAISLLLVADKLTDVGALIVDSPASNVKKVLEGVMQRENNTPGIFHPGPFLLMKILYHVDIDTIRPADHVAQVPNRKFLFLHGSLDLTIPPIESELLLKKANSQSIRVLFSKASHVETYKSDPKRYLDAVLPFLKEELEK